MKFVDDRIMGIKGQMEEIVQALGSETKSSAGDKHETGRAMLQLEREKFGQQLAAAEKIKHVLHKTALDREGNTVGPGSLVLTNNANYFIAISAGNYIENELSVYCISVNTPMAKVLLGKSEKDTFVFNGNEGVILKIV
ncbi:3-oxoacyl-ACP synthase [Spongiimicrobium sp. 3-5]|uniref:3-oxoacyl-ACP synthase n=1 Tax=Spongiimicrobium sp. 3-5 TaxID=3332596 RepID=UPI0039809C42